MGADSPPAGPSLSRPWALLPLGFYLGHVFGAQLVPGRPADLLWACHIANLVAAAGLMARSQRTVGIAFMWLILGNSLWVIDLLGGGRCHPTTLLTHLGGLTVTGWLVWSAGLPRGVWYQSVAALLLLLGLTRVLTPSGPNVNLAFRVHDGWEKVFPSHLWYVVMLMGIYAATFLCVELLLRRLLARRHGAGADRPHP